MLSLFLALAHALTLPGLPDVPLAEKDGTLVMGDDIPDPLRGAGVEPGWVLVAVDDLLLADGRQQVLSVIARGPARDLRLRFQLPDGSETLIVGRRQSLVRVAPTATLPWPDGFAAPAGGMVEGPRGQVSVADANGRAWAVSDGALVEVGAAGKPLELSPLFWQLTSAPWVFDDGVVDWGPESWARDRLVGAVRLGPYGDDASDHLVRPTATGIEVLNVDPPRGTARVPSCSPNVPETCLASGRQILAELHRLDGAKEEALRHLELACAGGVYRGCFEAEAVERPEVAERVADCVDGAEATACLAVSEEREQFEDGEPSRRLIGMLDLTCELEGAGTLGERLRRLQDVGEGCATLSDAYDRAGQKEQALLALDRACVLGRAEACELAQQRRDDAFAARTVRECEDEENPIAPSCVELGRLLQTKPVSAATLDDFGAFLRGCSLGSAQGCMALGDYVDRWGIDNERVAGAEAQLSSSCDQGELRACMGAAYLLERHEPRSDAYGEALVLFDRACDGRIGDACVAGASQRRIGMARKVDASDPLEQWGEACALNNPEGCAGLGERQARAKVSWPMAFSSFTRACDLGYAHACSELGPFVEIKHEPAYDGEQAPEVYLERGCDNGDPEGCYWLAERSLPKHGEPPEATYLLLETACEGDYGDGCASLAQVHLDRRTSFDDEIAARHLDNACNNGVYESCKTLGKMYASGKGVDRDRAKARELRQRFQLNAERKYVRIGASVGIPILAGGELELVAPIPIGPAISIAGQASSVPYAGTFLVSLDGDDTDELDVNGDIVERSRPTMNVVGGMARLYPNNKARGLYVGVGAHRLSAEGGFPSELRQRQGWNAVVGLRTDSRYGFVGLETGVGQYGVVRTTDFDSGATPQEKRDDQGFPLIVPSFALSFGLAPI